MATGVALLRASLYGFLATTNEGGAPSVRLVQPLRVDDGAGVWVGTSPRSRKHAEIVRRPTASFAVEDRARFAYVTVSGAARIVVDEAERVARWADGLEAFFPAGPTGDDFVLVHLETERIELMDFSKDIAPDPYGLVPAVVELRGGRWSVI